MDGDSRELAAAYVLLLLLGWIVGVWGAFLVPLRLFGHPAGVADAIGLLGPAAAGYLAAIGLRSAPAAVMPGIGWILAIIMLSYQRGGDVVIPGSLGTDPAVAVIGTIYLPSGLVGTLLAGVLAGRRLRRLSAQA